MYLYTVLQNGRELLAAAQRMEGPLYRLEDYGLCFRDMNDLIDRVTPAELATLRHAPEAAPMEDYTLLAPIPRPKQDVLCLGINYSDHAREASRFDGEAFGGQRPVPIFFAKRVTEAAAPGETIPSYQGLVDSLDYEVELAVILGKPMKNCPPEQVRAHIFGYTVLNDISARNLQTQHKQWYRGKSLDKFTPMGPCIVTADSIPWPVDLEIECYVNEKLRQKSRTSNLITTIDEAFSMFSQGLTLQAGTILATGTPAGVGMGMTPPEFLQPGDEILCRIEGIGDLRTVIGE